MNISTPLVKKLVNFGYIDQSKLNQKDANTPLLEYLCSISAFSAIELAQKAAMLFQTPYFSIKNIDLTQLPEGKERNEKLIKKHRVLPIALKGKKTLPSYG
jgi:type IV pilus assembly protein PilB